MHPVIRPLPLGVTASTPDLTVHLVPVAKDVPARRPKSKRSLTMAKLCVNIDHIATLRQARREEDPDPITAARLVEKAGAHGITVHLREDRRHIQDADVVGLRKSVKTKLNLEMAATEEMIRFALKVKPDQVTLVPEKRKELTTEGAWRWRILFLVLKRPSTVFKRRASRYRFLSRPRPGRFKRRPVWAPLILRFIPEPTAKPFV